MAAETSNARGEWVLVPREIVDRFPEINPSNYDHDDACALNAWGVELVLAAKDTAPPPAAAEVWMFKGTDGAWHTFHNEQHRLDTIADGKWDVRKFTALSQQPEARGVVDEAMVEEANERMAIAAYEKFMGVRADDPAYGPDLYQWMAGWNAALATQHQEPKS